MPANEVVVSASSSNISNLSNSTSYDGLLKDVYLPALVDHTFNDPAFLALIQRSSANIDYKGQRVIRGFKKQRGGGVGPIAEGGAFRGNVPMKGQQGYEQVKYLNAYFSLSGPSMRAAKDDMSAFVSLVSDSFDDTMKNTKNDLERQVIGEGTGAVAQVNDATPTGATFSVSGEAFFDTQMIMPGHRYWFTPFDYSQSGSGFISVRTVIDGTNTYGQVVSTTKGSKRTGDITLGTVTLDAAISANVANSDYMIREFSYLANSSSTIQTSAANCLEINGLQNLVSDGVDHSGDTDGKNESAIKPYAYSWNLLRSTETDLKSMVRFVNAELDEELLLEYIMELEYQYQASPNLLLVSPRAMLKYFSNVKDDRRFNIMTAMEWTGGYTGLGIQLGNLKLMLTTVGSCPSKKMFIINTNDFAFATMTNDFEWISDGGQILRNKEGSDNVFATAVNYLQLVCNDPGRQMKGYGITV